MRKQKGRFDFGVAGGLLASALLIALLIAAGVGWILNIVSIFHADFGNITGVLVLRVIGVFVAPLGSILGFC